MGIVHDIDNTRNTPLGEWPELSIRFPQFFGYPLNIRRGVRLTSLSLFVRLKGLDFDYYGLPANLYRKVRPVNFGPATYGNGPRRNAPLVAECLK